MRPRPETRQVKIQTITVRYTPGWIRSRKSWIANCRTKKVWACQPLVASKNSIITMPPAPKSSRKKEPDGSGAHAPSAISAAAAAPPNPSNAPPPPMHRRPNKPSRRQGKIRQEPRHALRQDRQDHGLVPSLPQQRTLSPIVVTITKEEEQLN